MALGGHVHRRPLELPIGQLDPHRGADGGAAAPELVGLSEPSSDQSSNISPYDTRSTIAPRLPTPSAGEDGNPHIFLVSARHALLVGQTGEAQEALERAETRLLDRSTPAFRTNEPSRSPLIEQIRTILAAVSVNDRGRAVQLLDAVIAETGGQGRPPSPR